MYVDTKANSHTESVEIHTFFSIHLPTIKTVLYADPCMVGESAESFRATQIYVGVIFT